MKYLFRDRIPKGCSLATFVKYSGDTHPDHHDYHPHYELYFRRSPLLQDIVLNGESLHIESPCAVLTAPFQIHAMSPLLLSEQFERHIIYFDLKLLDRISGFLPHRFFEQSSNSLFILSLKEAAMLESMLPIIFDDSLPEEERALALALLFCRLERSVAPSRRHRFGQIKTYIPQVLQFLHDHIADALSTDGIAARFHVSRAKLNRDFRASVGQSLHGAITDLRIAQAKSMLRERTASVSEIARQCGFPSEHYFYDFFKRHVGLTPLQYRKGQDVIDP